MGMLNRPWFPLGPDYFRSKTAQFSELRGTRGAIVGLLKLLRMKLYMKAIVYAQLHPVKTMKQFINDRGLYRVLILAMLVMNWCF